MYFPCVTHARVTLMPYAAIFNTMQSNFEPWQSNSNADRATLATREAGRVLLTGAENGAGTIRKWEGQAWVVIDRYRRQFIFYLGGWTFLNLPCARNCHLAHVLPLLASIKFRQ
jgi:hypothetical protein